MDYDDFLGLTWKNTEGKATGQEVFWVWDENEPQVFMNITTDYWVLKRIIFLSTKVLNHRKKTNKIKSICDHIIQR